MRTLTELDRKLATVFKALLRATPEGPNAGKLNKDFHSVCERIIDVTFRPELKRLFDEFRQPAAERQHRKVEDSIGCIRELRERGFIETAALLFGEWREALGALSLERVLENAPDADCIETWRTVTKAPLLELERKLLADPCATYATAGADWLMARGKPEHLLPLLDLFLTKQVRPPYLLPWNEALVAALKKDKRGLLLGATLRSSWPTENRITALAEAVSSNRALLRPTVDLLPALLAQKDAPAAAARFVGELFRTVLLEEGLEREFKTSALARLGSGIVLADRRGTQTEAALGIIQSISGQLRNLTRDEALQAHTWLLVNLGHKEEPTDAKLRVSKEGARQVALAIEKATQGFTAKDILTVMARNLGLSLLGKPGEVVRYDPLRHEDLEGGRVPGVLVRVEEAGWAINQETLIRAKVKPAQGGSHV